MTHGKSDGTDGALRALAGTRKGPFRVIGYALDRGDAASALKAAVEAEFPKADPVLVVDPGDPWRPAAERDVFKTDVLGRIVSTQELSGVESSPSLPPAEDRKEAKLRERLDRAVVALPDLLSRIDRTLASRGEAPPPPTSSPALTTVVERPKAPRPSGEGKGRPDDRPDPAPLVFFLSFEDVGGDAGAVSLVLRLLIERGSHVIISADGLDTRTREGRVVARAALRLGSIRSGHARERSRREAEKRRMSLRVYGPIPYGYRREGSALRPVADEQKLIARMKDLAESGRRVADILTTLNRDRCHWKDGTPWTWRRVSQVLKNPLHEGRGERGTGS